MSRELLAPNHGWDQVLHGLRQDQYEYFSSHELLYGRQIASQELGSADQFLVIVPIMSQPPERLVFGREIGVSSLRPSICHACLESSSKGDSLQPLCLSFDEITTLTNGEIDLPAIIKPRGIQRGITNAAAFLYFYDILSASIPIHGSDPILAGTVRNKETGGIYHITYLYPRQISQDLPRDTEVDFKDSNGSLLAKINLSHLPSGISDLSKAALLLVVEDVLHHRETSQCVAADVYGVLSEIQKVRPETEDDFERFLDTFFIPLYRQYAQFLLYCYKRLDDQNLELKAKDGVEVEIAPSAIDRLDACWKKATDTHFILTNPFPSKNYPSPDPIKVEWDIDKLTSECLVRALDWWEQLINLKNWYPKEGIPTFCFLEEGYRDLARIFLRGMQISEFDRRVYIPNYSALTQEQQQALWDFMAERYEGLVDSVQKQRIFQVFNEAIVRLEIENPVILDACCGSGLYAGWMKFLKSQVIGLDFSPQMLELARSTGRYDLLVQQSIKEPLEFEAGSFDAVLLSFASHLIDLESIASEFSRILKPGGILLVNFYEPQLGWDEEFGKRLRRFGFEVLKIVEENVGNKEINVLVFRRLE